MSERSFSVGESFNRGWEAFSAQMGVVIGGSVVLIIICFAGSAIPFVGYLFQLIILPVFIGGGLILVMNAVNKRRAEVANIFEGFQEFGTWLGIYWLLGVINVAAVLPGILVAAIGAATGAAVGGDGGDAVLVVGIVLGSIAAVTGSMLVTVIWGLSSYVVADNWHEGSIITALKKSAAITRGHRVALFLGFLLAGLINIAGMLACCIGIIFTMPVSLCFISAMYKDLREIYEGVPRGATEAAAPAAPGAAISAGPRTWYYAKAGRSMGPYSVDEMRTHYTNGDFGPNDYVFCSGVTEDWVLARDMPEITHPSPETAPEAPPEGGGESAGGQGPDEGPIDTA